MTPVPLGDVVQGHIDGLRGPDRDTPAPGVKTSVTPGADTTEGENRRRRRPFTPPGLGPRQPLGPPGRRVGLRLLPPAIPIGTVGRSRPLGRRSPSVPLGLVLRRESSGHGLEAPPPPEIQAVVLAVDGRVGDSGPVVLRTLRQLKKDP